MTKMTVKAPKGTINIPVPGEKPLHLKDGDDVPEHLQQRAQKDGWGVTEAPKRAPKKEIKKEDDE